MIRMVIVRSWVCWCLGAGYCFNTCLLGNCWWTGTGMWNALQGVCISIRGQSDVNDRSSCFCQIVPRHWPAGCWCPGTSHICFIISRNSHWLHTYELSLTWDAGHPSLCVISPGTHSPIHDVFANVRCETIWKSWGNALILLFQWIDV